MTKRLYLCLFISFFSFAGLPISAAFATCLLQCEGKIVDGNCSAKREHSSASQVFVAITCQAQCSAPGGPVNKEPSEPHAKQLHVIEIDKNTKQSVTLKEVKKTCTEAQGKQLLSGGLGWNAKSTVFQLQGSLAPGKYQVRGNHMMGDPMDFVIAKNTPTLEQEPSKEAVSIDEQRSEKTVEAVTADAQPDASMPKEVKKISEIDLSDDVVEPDNQTPPKESKQEKENETPQSGCSNSILSPTQNFPYIAFILLVLLVLRKKAKTTG